MTWTRLVYGTSVILALLTQLTIYQGANRTVVKSVDVVELMEGARERLMPFGDHIATNILIYEQALWRPMATTNTWQLGGDSNRTYLAFNGLQSCTVQVVNSSSYIPDGTNVASFWRWFDEEPYWFGDDGESVPGTVQDGLNSDQVWQLDAIQTGRTYSVNMWGETNEVPAYVYIPHTTAVGVYNQQKALEWIDSAILGVITGYVDHEAAVAGVFTQQDYSIPTLTTSSVWTRLHLPCIWTNISRSVTNTCTNWVDSWTNSLGNQTNVTRIGTNAAWNVSTNITTNYTFTTGAICTTNMLWERYRVMQYLRWTKQDATYYHEYPTWTNSEFATGTNLYWGDTYPETNYTITTESPWALNTPLWEPPAYPSDFPEWWDFSATNGPPGGWWAPLETPVFDDTADLGSYSSTTGRPCREASLTAINLKYQSYASEAWYLYYGYYRWVFTKAQHLEGHTTVNQRRSCPVIQMPANIGQIPVTADIYGKIMVSGDNIWTATPTKYTFRTNLVAGADVTTTTSNAFTWIGPALTPAFDLFTPTNVYFHTSWYSWANAPVSIDGIYDGFASNGVWNLAAGYQSYRRAEVIGNGVILKWTFSRCRP